MATPKRSWKITLREKGPRSFAVAESGYIFARDKEGTPIPLVVTDETVATKLRRNNDLFVEEIVGARAESR